MVWCLIKGNTIHYLLVTTPGLAHSAQMDFIQFGSPEAVEPNKTYQNNLTNLQTKPRPTSEQSLKP